MSDQNELENVPVDPVATCEDFIQFFSINNKEFPYLNQIQQIIASGTRSFQVDFNDLNLHDPKLAADIQQNPDEYLKKFNQAVINKLHDIEPKAFPYTRNNIFVRIKNLPRVFHRSVSQIRQEDINVLITIHGSALNRSEVYAKIVLASFECKVCQAVHAIHQDHANNPLETSLEYPKICNIGGCKNSKKNDFVLNGKTSEYRDWQYATIQEQPEDIDVNAVPRTLRCILTDDMVDSLRPGDRVSIVGIMRPSFEMSKSQSQGKTRILPLVLYVNNVVMEDKADIARYDDEDIKKFHESVKQPEWESDVILSIAPGLAGLEMEKLAIVLQLVGGVKKIGLSKHRIRGDIHILLIGDPSTGKSQLLTASSRLSHRAILTQGSGVTKAGLTGGIVNDEVSKLRVLEAGALPLAHEGEVCADEIDKMRKEDRESIHGAMEQQEIHINKAGFSNITLKCETSLLAAANPKRMRYDDSLSVAENLNLDTALLSRFDLIFIIRDIPDETNDDKIATRVIKNNQSIEDGDTSPKIEIEYLKKLLHYAKKECKPRLSNEAGEILKQHYLKLRKIYDLESKSIPAIIRNLEGFIRLAEAHAKIFLRDTVIEEDAERVIEVSDYVMNMISMDKTTKSFDVDSFLGKPRRVMKQINSILEMIQNLHEEARKDNPDAKEIDTSQIHERAGFKPYQLKPNEVDKCLEQLRTEGKIAKVGKGKIRLVKA